MSVKRQPGGIAVAFANKDFRTYTLGSLPSTIGTWIQKAGVMWLTWTLTESAAWLGAIGFADMFPVVVIGPLAGAFADRLDRLLVAKIIQYLHMFQAIALVALTATGMITIEILFGLSVLTGIFHAALQPFRQSIVPNLVKRETLPSVIAVNSAAWHGSRFVGPAIGGIVLTYWGVIPTFVINALSYPIFIYALSRIQLPPRAVVSRSIAEVPREIIAGVRHAFSHPGIAPVLIILFAASFFGRPVMELLAAFASDIFERDADGLGKMLSAAGFGAMAVGIWFAQWGRAAWLVRLSILSLAGAGVSLALFALTDDFWIALFLLAVLGGFSTIGGITTQTLVQSMVDDKMRGRVMSVYGMIWMGVPGAGALLAGALSDVVGLQWPFVGAGVLCLIAWLWALGRRKTIVAAQFRGENE